MKKKGSFQLGKQVLNKKPKDSIPLLICTWFLKNKFEKIQFDEVDFYSISNLIFTACVACKIILRIDFRRLKIQSIELDFSKFKYRSTGGVIRSDLNDPLVLLNNTKTTQPSSSSRWSLIAKFWLPKIMYSSLVIHNARPGSSKTFKMFSGNK